ncbi:MAG: L,D-transpeptidase family protein [Chloroflexota bacterium]|nr:L,D-transpeptidase family protein [Chloroflexota bacterium]
MSGENSVQSDGLRKAKSPLEQGIALANEGKHAEARAVFRRIIRSTPHEEEAWLWLAWVADEKRESLRILREARIILPQSERIAEGLRWIEEELAEEQAEALPEADVGAGERIEGGFAFSKVDDAAERAVSGARRAFAQVKAKVAGIRLPRGDLARLRRFAALFLPLLVLVGLAALVWLGISRARQEDQIVQALELPTRVPNPTATPSVEQRTKSLWIQVDVAWMKGDWDAVIETLQRIRVIDPQNEEARSRLAEAYFNDALQLIADSDIQAARVALDEAVRLDAGSDNLQRTRRCLSRYMAGLEAYWAQDWSRAVEELSNLYELDPNFRDTKFMLAKAYYGLGVDLQENEVWDEAIESYERAIELVPEMENAQARIQQVRDILVPPARIEVDLSDKWVTVYEDHKEIRSFICCTGRASAPTLPGRYEVQSKLPMAHASAWDLDMPFWLGIYWAGGSENGIHALPILSNGATLWRQALGTGCSYGCIVLDTPDAEFLYNWADVGTVVLVKP